jgi:hypothetical protein
MGRSLTPAPAPAVCAPIAPSWNKTKWSRREYQPLSSWLSSWHFGLDQNLLEGR